LSARLLLPAFEFLLSSPSLSFSLFTYLQPGGLRTETAQLSQQHRSQTSILQTSIFPSGVVPAYVSTEQHLHGVYNRGGASGRGHTREGTGDSRKKRQRQSHALHCQQTSRAQFPAGRFPAKFGCQPIKLELYRSRTPIPRNTNACTSGISGYIKGIQ